MVVKSFALNSLLLIVSCFTAVMVNNMKDFTRVLCIKLYIFMKVKYQDLFNAKHVRPVVNAI